MQPDKPKDDPRNDQNRSFRVTVRFTKDEITRLQKSVSSTVSREMADYVRHVVMGRKVQVIYRDRSMDEFIKELVALRKELNALGNNFNQVTKKVNATAGKKDFFFLVEHAATLQQTLLEKVETIKGTIEKFAIQWFAKSSPAATSGEP